MSRMTVRKMDTGKVIQRSLQSLSLFAILSGTPLLGVAQEAPKVANPDWALPKPLPVVTQNTPSSTSEKPLELFAEPDPFATTPAKAAGVAPAQNEVSRPAPGVPSVGFSTELKPATAIPVRRVPEFRLPGQSDSVQGERSRELAEPLPLAAPQNLEVRRPLEVQQGEMQRPVVRPSVRQDEFLTPVVNNEPSPQPGGLPAQFPESEIGQPEQLRMSPPAGSVFDLPEKPISPAEPSIPAFPADSAQIPPINSPVPEPVQLPERDDSFSGNAFEQTTSRPVNESFPAREPSRPSGTSQFNYDPPTGEPGLLEPATTRTPTPATVKNAEEVHEVQPGENFWTISRQHYGTARYFAALAEYNKHRIPRPDRMKPGMFVLIPQEELLIQRFPTIAGIVDSQPSPESLLPAGFFIGNDGQPYYRIGKGDTLTEIAELHLGRTARWSQIVGMNRDILRDGNTLKIGMVLRLPHDASQVRLAPAVD